VRPLRRTLRREARADAPRIAFRWNCTLSTVTSSTERRRRPTRSAPSCAKRSDEPRAQPFYRALDAVGVRAADEALLALRLVLGGHAATDEGVIAARAALRRAKAGDPVGARRLSARGRWNAELSGTDSSRMRSPVAMFRFVPAVIAVGLVLAPGAADARKKPSPRRPQRLPRSSTDRTQDGGVIEGRVTHVDTTWASSALIRRKAKSMSRRMPTTSVTANDPGLPHADRRCEGLQGADLHLEDRRKARRADHSSAQALTRVGPRASNRPP